MKCIFCKQNSNESISVEHIVPESFGNYNYILPKGIVCDKCNNYLAREVEKPFLELPVIKELRAEAGIPSKKGKMLTKTGLLIVDDIKIFNKKNQKKELRVKNPRFLFPYATDKLLFEKNSITSRFLAKVAFECLVDSLKDTEGALDYLINEKAFDCIRDYVRKGNNNWWDYSVRRIYEINEKVALESGEKDYVNWESDFLFLNGKENEDKTILAELYFVVIFFGVEYVINMGGNYIEGYYDWLKNNSNSCHLYKRDISILSLIK